MNKQEVIDYLKNIPESDWNTVTSHNEGLGEEETWTIELVDSLDKEEREAVDIFVSYEYEYRGSYGVGNKVIRRKYPECDADIEQMEEYIRNVCSHTWVIINNFKRL